MATAIQWKYIKQDNSNMHKSTKSVALSKFTVSATTTDNIGIVDSIVVGHYHTSTVNNSQWPLYVVLTLNSGKTLTSDIVTHSCDGAVRGWANTITGATPSDLLNDGIRSVSICFSNASSVRGDLYWRATSSKPITVTVNYRTKVPDAPVISGCSVAGKNATFDKFFANGSTVTFTSTVTVDSELLPSITSKTLTLSRGGTTLRTYSLARVSGTNTDTLGKIAYTGTLTWTLNVVDSYSNSATETGTITLESYIAPTISNFVAQRYSSIYGVDSPSTTGVYVWFSYNCGISSVSGNSTTNSGRVRLYVQEYGASSWTTVWDSGSGYIADGGTASATNDKTLDTTVRPASTRYVYRLGVSDKVTTVYATFEVSEATSLFNVERNGVAVGKMVDTGTVANPIFDVAMASRFRNGIGTDWIDLGVANNKNLLDVTQLRLARTTDTTAVMTTALGSGTVQCSTTTALTYHGVVTSPIFSGDTTYTVSGVLTAHSGDVQVVFRRSSNNAVVGGRTTLNANGAFTHTADVSSAGEAVYLSILGSYSTAQTFNFTITDLQVETGSSATAFNIYTGRSDIRTAPSGWHPGCAYRLTADNHVYIAACVAFTGNVVNALNAMPIPEAYRPTYDVSALCRVATSSGRYLAAATVTKDGAIAVDYIQQLGNSLATTADVTVTNTYIQMEYFV